MENEQTASLLNARELCDHGSEIIQRLKSYEEALVLISKQQAEIERLKKTIDVLSDKVDLIKKEMYNQMPPGMM